MADEENACIRNIVKEIIRECLPRKIQVNKNFVTFLTKLLLINPNWGINDDFFNQRQNVQAFVMYVIDELLVRQEEAKVVTMKIQFYYACSLEQIGSATELHRKQLKMKLSVLREDIDAVRKVSGKDEVDALYKKLIYYITLITGLGNPSLSKVYEEVLKALRSILDEHELAEFARLSKSEKHEKIKQFAKIVAGIRLFNKDCERGGEGISNLPELVNKAVDGIRTSTEGTLFGIMKRVNVLTTIVDKCYIVRNTYKGFQMQLELPADVQKLNVKIEHLKDLLIFFRQFELLIRKILEILDQVFEKSKTIYGNMENMLKTIHESVQLKIAIPVGEVFPLFEKLWNIWEQFQDQAIFLSRLNVIMCNLESYQKDIPYHQIVMDQIMGGSVSMTDAERLAKTAHITLNSPHADVKVIKSDSIRNIDNIELEYLGFCCWKLIETDGALIPGNPSMGVVNFKGKNYVFSCFEGFQEFCKDPPGYVNCVLDLARRKPQLINFFHLRDALESAYSTEKLVESKEDIRVCEDKCVQTPVNMEESLIVPEYKWNVWDLKREALMMGALTHVKTASTQTAKTCSNNSIKCQTYSHKEQEIQTKREAYTNVPKPSTFIYGLRGRRDDKQFKIVLTTPVEKS